MQSTQINNIIDHIYDKKRTIKELAELNGMNANSVYQTRYRNKNRKVCAAAVDKYKKKGRDNITRWYARSRLIAVGVPIFDECFINLKMLELAEFRVTGRRSSTPLVTESRAFFAKVKARKEKKTQDRTRHDDLIAECLMIVNKYTKNDKEAL
jgi:hypothetical protein